MTTAVDLIQRKRDRGVLSGEEIEWFLRGYTGGSVPDYQMAAMAMAIFLNDLDGSELVAWTGAMLRSGDILDFSDIELPKIDKHSTGGVGDKISIPLAPMVAACGVAIPMMSGRGLGHTGGTLDKLESIPGFTTALDKDRFHEILESCGLVLAGQSDSLVPADRKLYALRDATATVESIPLIASSIMSKKLAEDLDGLVLDVKYGSGAFMPERDRARRLAETMVSIGASHEVPTVALLTAMEQPLGEEVGNASEIRESIQVLNGGGPEDVVELTFTLGIEMLLLAGVAGHRDEARRRLEEARSSGRAMEVFASVVKAQGGDPVTLEDPSLLPSAPRHHVVEATQKGFVARCDAHQIGVAAMRLGAGRERKEDTIDPGVGITLNAKLGTEVAAGDPLLTLHYRHTARLDEALRILADATTITEEPPPPCELIAERIGF